MDQSLTLQLFYLFILGVAEHAQMSPRSDHMLCDSLDRHRQHMVEQPRHWCATYANWHHHRPTERITHEDEIHVNGVYHIMDRGETKAFRNRAHFNNIPGIFPTNFGDCGGFSCIVRTANPSLLLSYIFRRFSSPQTYVAIFGGANFKR